MKILVLGINYAPEMVGIGPYTAGMAEYLANKGHQVTVVCANPYYPNWKVEPAYKGKTRRPTLERGVRVVRLPVYVPSNPDGKRRVLHHLSFAVRAISAMFTESRRLKPDVVIGIAPSLISMIAARATARRIGAKFWLHIQDFEVEAALATGLLKSGGYVARAANAFEVWAINADKISTISPQMCAKLAEKGIPAWKITEFRNWSNVDEIVPMEGVSRYREEWGIEQPNVALYSGNIANKQGIEIVVEAARLLKHRKDLMFVVCGNGPNRTRLMEQSTDLDNIQFHDLQPRERLSDLLSMATVHLLPQIADAADLVLPSKLTNMLASGRPVVSTARRGTGLASEVEGCGLITPPEDPVQFALAIETLIKDEFLQKRFQINARDRAIERWSMQKILEKFEMQLGIFSSSHE